MNTIKLAGLEPASVFGYFEEICSMPHGSGNTKLISDYLVKFAREQGLEYIQDELNDVIRQFSIGWDVTRNSKLARSVMQLAIFEIRFLDDVPTGVAISEAVRIAKLYDGDDTGAFVNGILGAFARSLDTEVHE